MSCFVHGHCLQKAQVRLKDLEGSLRNKSSTLADKDLQLRQTQSMADDLQRLLQEERGKLHAAELVSKCWTCCYFEYMLVPDRIGSLTVTIRIS